MQRVQAARWGPSTIQATKAAGGTTRSCRATRVWLAVWAVVEEVDGPSLLSWWGVEERVSKPSLTACLNQTPRLPVLVAISSVLRGLLVVVRQLEQVQGRN